MAPRLVLVVEDDHAMARMLVDGLSDAGWRALATASAADAVERLCTCPFAAVLCDVDLWDGNGFDLLAQFQGRRDPIPFILMSAFASDEVARRACRDGAFALLSKPFGLEELLSLLDRLETRRAEESR